MDIRFYRSERNMTIFSPTMLASVHLAPREGLYVAEYYRTLILLDVIRTEREANENCVFLQYSTHIVAAHCSCPLALFGFFIVENAPPLARRRQPDANRAIPQQVARPDRKVHDILRPYATFSEKDISVQHWDKGRIEKTKSTKRKSSKSCIKFCPQTIDFKCLK